jgi:hypothetical protein
MRGHFVIQFALEFRPVEQVMYAPEEFAHGSVLFSPSWRLEA